MRIHLFYKYMKTLRTAAFAALLLAALLNINGCDVPEDLGPPVVKPNIISPLLKTGLSINSADEFSDLTYRREFTSQELELKPGPNGPFVREEIGPHLMEDETGQINETHVNTGKLVITVENGLNANLNPGAVLEFTNDAGEIVFRHRLDHYVEALKTTIDTVVIDNTTLSNPFYVTLRNLTSGGGFVDPGATVNVSAQLIEFELDYLIAKPDARYEIDNVSEFDFGEELDEDEIVGAIIFRLRNTLPVGFDLSFAMRETEEGADLDYFFGREVVRIAAAEYDSNGGLVFAPEVQDTMELTAEQLEIVNRTNFLKIEIGNEPVGAEMYIDKDHKLTMQLIADTEYVISEDG